MPERLLRTEYSKLGEVVKILKAQAECAEQIETNIKRQMDVLRASWMGKGHDKFVQLMNEQTLKKTKATQTAFEQASEVMAQVGQQIHDAEQQGKHIFAVDKLIKIDIIQNIR